MLNYNRILIFVQHVDHARRLLKVAAGLASESSVVNLVFAASKSALPSFYYSSPTLSSLDEQYRDGLIRKLRFIANNEQPSTEVFVESGKSAAVMADCVEAYLPDLVVIDRYSAKKKNILEVLDCDVMISHAQ